MRPKVLIVICLVYGVVANVNNGEATDLNNQLPIGKILIAKADKYWDDTTNRLINTICNYCQEYLTTHREQLITDASKGIRSIGIDFPEGYIHDMYLPYDIENNINRGITNNFNLTALLSMVGGRYIFRGITFSW